MKIKKPVTKGKSNRLKTKNQKVVKSKVKNSIVKEFPKSTKKIILKLKKMKIEFTTTGIDKLVGTALDDSNYLNLKYVVKENRKGVTIGYIETKDGKRLEISLQGSVSISNFKGDTINTSNVLEVYLKENRTGELNHDSAAYIQVYGENGGKMVMGVFYSLADMISWAKEQEVKHADIFDFEIV